jgi:hypothetical protein
VEKWGKTAQKLPKTVPAGNSFEREVRSNEVSFERPSNEILTMLQRSLVRSLVRTSLELRTTSNDISNEVPVFNSGNTLAVRSNELWFERKSRSNDTSNEMTESLEKLLFSPENFINIYLKF